MSVVAPTRASSSDPTRASSVLLEQQSSAAASDWWIRQSAGCKAGVRPTIGRNSGLYTRTLTCPTVHGAPSSTTHPSGGRATQSPVPSSPPHDYSTELLTTALLVHVGPQEGLHLHAHHDVAHQEDALPQRQAMRLCASRERPPHPQQQPLRRDANQAQLPREQRPLPWQCCGVRVLRVSCGVP